MCKYVDITEYMKHPLLEIRQYPVTGHHKSQDSIWKCQICCKDLLIKTKYTVIYNLTVSNQTGIGWTCLNERCVEMFIFQNI